MKNSKMSSTGGPVARRLHMLSRTSFVVAVTATLTLTACASGTSTGPTPSTSTGASSQATAAALDESAASLLPAEYKGKTLTVALDTGNLPWSDHTPDQSSFVGINHDLIEAATAVLGVNAKYEATSFANMIPGVQGGRYDIALSNIFDNVAREKIVDEVTYAEDGQILIAKKGGKTGLTENSLCGLKVAAVAGGVQAKDLPSRSEKCLAEGKQPIDVQVYPVLADQYLAVTAGRADVLNTTISIGDQLMQTRPNDFERASPAYQTVPIAMVLKKDSPISEAMAAALNVLIENGTYAKIFDKAGMNARVDESKVNPATARK